MLERAFVVVADERYTLPLAALLNSIHAYHGCEIPVFVYERGFGDIDTRIIEQHPLKPTLLRVRELPFHPDGMWEAKQQVFAHCLGRARVVLLIDADVVLTSPLNDIFELAATGKIVAGIDTGHIEYTKLYDVYSTALAGQNHAYINSGMVCLDVVKHWDVVGLWAFASIFGYYSPKAGFPLQLPGYGDQGLLNPIIALLRKTDELHVLPSGIWHECQGDCSMVITTAHPDGRLEVLNVECQQPQRILHSTGPKWWIPEGAEAIRHHGDKLRCYRHFARWPLPWNGVELHRFTALGPTLSYA